MSFDTSSHTANLQRLNAQANSNGIQPCSDHNESIEVCPEDNPPSPSFLNSAHADLFDNLNVNQRAAVTAPFDTHVLVLAGAGCGKTAVLTRRIAFCASFSCPQETILALTFTRKAAGEMKQRLRALPGINNGRPMPRISTFHGFCLQLLTDLFNGRPLYAHLGYTSLPTLLSGRDTLTILAGCCSSKQRQFLQTDLSGVDNLLSQRAVFPDKLDSLAPEQKNVLARIAERVQQVKLQENAWDFSDMIGLVVKACSSIDGFSEYLQQQYRAVLVDEFQDTNPIQIGLLNHILGTHTKLFAVGDDDQAIYGFRGADPRPILTFNSLFSKALIVRLEINYRSRPAILDTANKIFSQKPKPLRKVLRSGIYREKKQYGIKPGKKVFGDQYQMIGWMAKKMHLLSAQGFAFSEMTVLCRINQSCRWIEKKLKELLENGSNPRVMTVHAAKGLEFPVVFVCDCEEGVFPSCKIKRQKDYSVLKALTQVVHDNTNTETEKAIQEESRLFYVAVTRAQHQLFCLSVRKRVCSGRSMETRPSRFLKYIG